MPKFYLYSLFGLFQIGADAVFVQELRRFNLTTKQERSEFRLQSYSCEHRLHTHGVVDVGSLQKLLLIDIDVDIQNVLVRTKTN